LIETEEPKKVEREPVKKSAEPMSMADALQMAFKKRNLNCKFYINFIV